MKTLEYVPIELGGWIRGVVRTSDFVLLSFRPRLIVTCDVNLTWDRNGFIHSYYRARVLYGLVR